jgi:hypothetical protein
MCVNVILALCLDLISLSKAGCAIFSTHQDLHRNGDAMRMLDEKIYITLVDALKEEEAQQGFRKKQRGEEISQSTKENDPRKDVTAEPLPAEPV